MKSAGGMSVFQRFVLEKLYARAGGAPEGLPWHRAEPDAVLQRVVAASMSHGRALDVGCGSGVFSAYLAKQGYRVTAIDLHPAAVAMARRLAEGFGDKLSVFEADFFSFKSAEPFDLVYDSGCLHCMKGGALQDYKSQLLRLLAPGGDYVLAHFDKRHAFDWRPMGPRRRTPAQLEPLFAPELELREKSSGEVAVPLPIGPVVRGTVYWFHRPK